MKIWIRSQDKENLIKVDNIQYKFIKGDLYTGVRGHHYIKTYYDELKILGEYETKERALEVLDEIQNILMPKSIIKFDTIVNEEDIQRFKKLFNANEPIILNKATVEHLDTYVYEMPKE